MFVGRALLLALLVLLLLLLLFPLLIFLLILLLVLALPILGPRPSNVLEVRAYDSKHALLAVTFRPACTRPRYRI